MHLQNNPSGEGIIFLKAEDVRKNLFDLIQERTEKIVYLSTTRADVFILRVDVILTETAVSMPSCL